MTTTHTREPVLVVGAGVAGPVVAHRLARHGYAPVVVERAARQRHGMGGHAVDLFGPAVDVIEQMGLLDEVVAARTRNDVVAVARPGRRSFELDVSVLAAGVVGDRHMEVLRGDLARILYEATRDDVEYVFDDGVRSVVDDGDRSPDFYFDAISQVRMSSWTRGRVALVGDAGYAPGPAVGGGTTAASVGAHILADRLAWAGGDHRAAFPGYEARWASSSSPVAGSARPCCGRRSRDHGSRSPATQPCYGRSRGSRSRYGGRCSSASAGCARD